MNVSWTIAQPSPDLRIVRLQESVCEGVSELVATQLAEDIAATYATNTVSSVIELDFSDWADVDSRLFAFLIHIYRLCQQRGYHLKVSSPPRLLSEMANRLGFADELSLGVSRSLDYSPLFKSEGVAG
jgi:ABC-type transporter Mla MlaB component